MKALQIKEVVQALQKNVQIYISTQGEGMLVGLDDFTDEMLDKFDLMFSLEIDKLNRN